VIPLFPFTPVFTPNTAHFSKTEAFSCSRTKGFFIFRNVLDDEVSKVSSLFYEIALLKIIP
jgi:hypothetical protein